MFKKLFIFLSFFFISAIPAFASCSVTVSPSSIPANTDTSVTMTVNNSDSNASGLNYSFDVQGGTFSSFTQPSWASSCTNYTSNIGCYTNNSYSSFPLTSVVNIPSNQTVYIGVADPSGDYTCTTQLSATGGDNPPTVNPISNATINKGATYSANGSFTDSDSTSWTATVDYGDGSGTQSLTLSGMNFSLSHVYNDDGIYTVTVKVTDNQGATGTQTTQVTVKSCSVTVSPSSIQANTDTPITITATENDYAVNNVNFSFDVQGGTFSSFTQPNWASSCNNYTNNIGCYTNNSYSSFPLSSVVNIPSNQTLIIAMDVGGPSDVCTTQLHVTPTVGAITAPSSPVLVNTAITASANFTDTEAGTHTASWNWGDGNTTTGTVTESNGSGSVSNTHTYTATGVYTITLSVANATNGATGTSTFQYVAVYDSSTSFAGGRSFDNPSSASPSTTGKVSFGITSKYSNSNTLTGNVKMNFKAASIDFVSTSLSSLATSTGKAYLKGNGTVNGSGNYTFLATGIDGSVVGGNDLIRFQIKDASNNVIYDSQPGAGDTTDPTTTVATGNIRVH